ncbi:MAG: NUDIX domain-containing protein [Phycisphaerales bacterium]
MTDHHPIELIARGVYVRGGAVLLCKNVKHGYYYLPGGHVEFGEAAAGALAREIQEEAGLRAAVGPMVLASEHVFEAGRTHHEVNLVFHVEQITSPDGSPAEEIRSVEDAIAFEFVDLAGVTDLDVRPAEIRAWLAAGGRIDPAAGWISAAGAPPLA